MSHVAYKRIVPDSDTAVLFIHGIAGTPNHFYALLPMVPGEWSVHNLLLDGHGKGVRDFSATSMDKWRKQVSDAAAELLRSNKRLYIVAHSMGTLFAMEQAMKHPGQIVSLFLMAPPLKVFVRPTMVANAMKVFLGCVKPTDVRAVAAKESYGIEKDLRFWRYIGWLPRLTELFRQIRWTRERVGDISVPSNVFLSRGDEIVSLASGDYLKDNSCFSVTVLEGSGHFYYSPEDKTLLCSAFETFLAQS